MDKDLPVSDDPGTVLESFTGTPRDLPAAVPVSLTAGPKQPQLSELHYRAIHRWPTPRILICDDGSLDEGEVFFVRTDKVLIGRVDGDIAIGHDFAMSGSHAEIVRTELGGKIAWVLRDLDSSNGTYVRVRTLTLRPGAMIQLGSKRYRFEQPEPMRSRADPDPGTVLFEELRDPSEDLLATLVECRAAGETQSIRHPFRLSPITIGRPGFGNTVSIDDLCLAGTHAVVNRDASGTWHLEAQQSINGVWVKVEAVKLTSNCLFQCGEQRFRFRLPGIEAS